MPKKKDNILEKIVKKDYNNELELILEEKNFSENARSMILTILYKIEAAYKDLEKVKRNVESKDEYIRTYIHNIQNKCNHIKIIHMTGEESKIEENKTFLIDKPNKEIQCYPIERKLLYAINKISKRDRILKSDYYIIDETISDLINIGNCINMVEPLRDFNGYSWTTLPREIESIPHNLIYQNLRILLGYEFLNKWINNSEFVLDYFDTLKNELKEKYGKKNEETIIENLTKISVLLEARYDKEKKDKLIQTKKQIDQKLNQLEDKEKFIEEITKEKMKIAQKIREYDTILNNKDELEKEYIKRNEELPLDKKIFSIRILTDMMIREREKEFEKIEDLNEKLKPQNYVKYKKELIKKQEILEEIDSENLDKEIDKLLLKMQKSFISSLQIRIKNAELKQEVINLICEYRYYNLLPMNTEKSIYQEEKLKEDRIETENMLINKAIEKKVINEICKIEELNQDIIRNIYLSRIINLEDLYLKIIKEKNEYYLQLFDEKIFDEKIELENIQNIDIKNAGIKINRKIKLFE